MRTRSVNHRLTTSWITILALLLGSLAPLVSHALARSGDVVWQDICTSASRDLAATERVGRTGQPVPMPDAGHAFGHCPCCGSNPVVLGLPPSPLAVLPPSALPRLATPQRFLTAARTPPVWVSAQPRAPPRRA